MIELSFNSKKPTVVEPRFLIIYSKPKVGKTSNLLQLPNSLLIDLENSSDLYEGNAINVQKIAQANGVSPIKVLKEISVKIEKANGEAKKAVYDYITLDSATVLEEYAVRLATANYKQTVIGKNFTGTNVVSELPQGAGCLQ